LRERLLEPLVVAPESSFAAKQLADGRVLTSDLSAFELSEEQTSAWRRTIAAGINAFLPQLEFVSYPLVVQGFYDVTPDHQPILGTVESLEGLWLATGFSGHGFMMAPAIGRRLADAVVGANKDRCLDEFSLARFEESELTHELQIV
jgi:sarcosine oxidase subunit beta